MFYFKTLFGTFSTQVGLFLNFTILYLSGCNKKLKTPKPPGAPLWYYFGTTRMAIAKTYEVNSF